MMQLSLDILRPLLTPYRRSGRTEREGGRVGIPYSTKYLFDPLIHLKHISLASVRYPTCAGGQDTLPRTIQKQIPRFV